MPARCAILSFFAFWVFIFGIHAQTRNTNPRDSRAEEGSLQFALAALQEASESGDEAAQILIVERIVSPFYGEAYVFDRAGAKLLERILITYLKTDGATLTSPVIEAMIEGFKRENKALRERDSYHQRRWLLSFNTSFRDSLYLGGGAATAAVLTGSLVRPLRLWDRIRSLGRGLEKASESCPKILSGLLRVPGQFLSRRPRISVFTSTLGAVTLGSHYFYFGHQENWDPVEESVGRRILPELQSMLSRARRRESAP